MDIYMVDIYFPTYEKAVWFVITNHWKSHEIFLEMCFDCKENIN